MQRVVSFVVFVLVFLSPTLTFGQVLIDTSSSIGRGVDATTVRLTATLLTPLPGLPAGGYTADFQWDPLALCLAPVEIVTGPAGPFLPNLTGTYSVSLASTRFGCANPLLNQTSSAVGIMRLTQHGDSVTGFGWAVAPGGGSPSGVGIEAVVTATNVTGQFQLLTTQGLLGTGTMTSTVGTVLNLSFTGSYPAIGCQFTGSGAASKVAP